MNEFQKIHVQTVSANLQQLVADRKFLDVTLAVQGHEIHSNRMVLSASSEYFRGLFEFYGSHSPLPKRSRYDLTSEFLTIKGFQFIVNFIHSLGQLCDPIPTEDYECLYTAASFLQVQSLHAMLSNLIGCHLDSTSVLQALRLATVFDDPQLYQKCMFVLLDQFQTVDIFSGEYFNLSQRHIQTIFLSDRVKVSRESFMVEALLSWLCFDLPSRSEFFRNHFGNLLRLPLDCCDQVDFMLDDVVMEVVDRFVYLGSCISSGGGVGNEIEARISKARAVFANLRHLWRQRCISLKLKGRVYKTTVRAVLLYGSETWPLRVEDVNRLQVFDHRCLRSIARIGWHQRDAGRAIEAVACESLLRPFYK
ncbi:uncharacterized protein DEA37_0000256 [Paragonimus westermani]|uniref:BTB domain-containing protein n=1 Tax=Paragonimus westermani TaxID=34504 RepID=A0A5J4NLB7_9TREM|nr:uncharacterized protein DEA37_0000256 [Paragonimus westermani]